MRAVERCLEREEAEGVVRAQEQRRREAPQRRSDAIGDSRALAVREASAAGLRPSTTRASRGS
jgi:hypothetical protein